MAQSDTPPPGPDLTQGVPLSSVPEAGMLAGHVDGAAVLLARIDGSIHAVAGTCTHYGAPLAEGLLRDGEIHCPWHHACFSLRTGTALGAPAFAPLATFDVDIVGDTVFVRGVARGTTPAPMQVRAPPERIVIIGGGAAGFAAATRLRELGFSGAVSMLSADSASPCDRPNLSKDYLAGTAPEDWIPLQGPDFYSGHEIELRLDCEVVSIDAQAQRVVTASGDAVPYNALLLATGAEPRRLPTPGFDRPNVFVLRSLADARAIIAACANARRVALIGAGFIGMEAAAALRTRGLEVHVVAQDRVPLERVLGPDLGAFVSRLHRAHGVEFHLQRHATGFDGAVLVLDDGSRVPADFVIVGAGVVPRTALASATGMQVQDGILVDEYLETSIPRHFAAGDVARYRRGGESIRIEHWVHAQRQGQAAAANLLGARQPFTDVPFFWTHHYGLDVRYTGHAKDWDEIRFEGDPDRHDCMARFLREGQVLAAASIGRDQENLAVEAALHD